MPKTTPTYNTILAKLTKLQAENKRLRLRPSVHSPEANILEFMDIKEKLAHATLAATDIKTAVEISLKHILKITNIHSVSFFKKEHRNNNNNIDLIKQHGLPKKLIQRLNHSDFLLLNKPSFFPTENKVYYSADLKPDSKSLDSSFLSHLKSFQTLFILPIISNEYLNISILLLSKKEFNDDKYIRVLYQSIRAQLNSSFSRILMTEKLKIQSAELKNSISERTLGLENMNKELIQQIRIHRQKEQNISEELELFKSIILQQNDLVLRINKEGQILYFNPQFKHAQKTHEDMEESILNYFGNGDFPGLDFIIWDFDRNVQRVSCEIQLAVPKKQWFNVNFSPIKNRRGMLTEIQIVARNINEIKKLEQKLRTQRKMLFSMLDTTEKISFTINKKGIIELVSNNIEAQTGNLVSSLINQPFHQFAHPHDIKIVRSNIRKLLSLEKERCGFNFRLKYSDNNWYWQKLNINTVQNEKGKTLYFVGSFYPIDEKDKVNE